MYELVDFVTKKRVFAHNFVFTGEDTPWEIRMDLDRVKSNIHLDSFRMTPPAFCKYLPFMPIHPIAQFVSLREAATPLIQSKVLGKQCNVNLRFKVESNNPTGSFKDRGSALEVSLAKQWGVPAIVLASTGNMAASCACYAAAAKIPCFVFIPEGVALAKMAQVAAFSGHIIQVKGNYNDAANLAKMIAEEKGLYLAGDYAYRVEGQKTAAFEILDQSLLEVPDVVILPIGCGTNMAAYAKGFLEYFQLGLIDSIPRLIGVQAEGACAVVHSFQQRQKTITPLSQADTIASAIAVPNPIDGIKALDAIYATQGEALAVTDDAMLHAQRLLAIEEGLFVESASAATVAALLQIAQEPSLAHQKVVCVLTGDGVKDANVVLKTATLPLTMHPAAFSMSLKTFEEAFHNFYGEHHAEEKM